MGQNGGGGSPLSRDIRYLGDMLGGIIREQQGETALNLVEEVRAIARERRSGDADATSRLTGLIAGLSLDQKNTLVRAFGNYFQLINIAEDLQRVRTLREREAGGSLHESLTDAIRTLAADGLSGAQVRALLDKVRVRLVLTAHPSEAKRQEVLIKLHDISDFMAAMERQPTLLPRERKRLVEDIVRRIEQLWQTRPTRATRATVNDEVEFGLYFLTSTLMDVTVDFYQELREGLEQHFPDTDWSRLPPVLRFASWIGGDRDGNPNVTAEVTLATLDKLRQTAIRVYTNELDYLIARLTQSDDEVEVSPEIAAGLADQTEASHERYQGEPYRQHLAQVAAKLQAGGYPTGAALLADLRLVADSLRMYRGVHSADGTLQRLLLKIELFGLYLVPLDIREDSRHHVTALTELLRHYRLHEDYSSLPEADKQRILTREIASTRPLFPYEFAPDDPAFSEITRRVVAMWRMMAAAQRTYGAEVIDCFIGSMSQDASDVLAMLLFAKEVGIDRQLDLVPLFETVEDLQDAPGVLATLFANDEYRQHLEARGSRQQIMIGYSDSNKDGGYIASNWNLYEAQDTLSEMCRTHGVTLELFHGRGGSIGRGGGPTNRAILAQPPDSMQGPIKITEQGEVIAYRYSHPEIARRHLHQTMNAALLATARTSESQAMRPEWREAMHTLSQRSFQAYRGFIYEQPGFLTYWQQATPINELASMQIGSRPAKRKAGGFESIRAIPWVFSWMQSRAIIPSWYGVGYALEAFGSEQPDGLALLQAMYREWLFFANLIENVQLDLAKADTGIAALYKDLVGDADLREAIFAEIQSEHRRACTWICRIVEQQELLERIPVIKRSIERRNPYVDPLNFIQVDLLRQLRTLTPESPEYEPVLQAVLATVNGIAAGMKTTG